jgi:small subunit ribosomal protein S11
MNLSNILFNTVANKLNLKTLLLQEERFYVKNLLNQITQLKKLKENNYKNLSVEKLNLNNKQTNDQDLLVTYIISISFLKANTTIHISDIEGNIKLFYSAGSIGLTGKQKKKRRLAVSKLISLLLKKATFLSNKPIALHLNNVNFYSNLIVGKLKRTLYIRVIKSFNQTPYNGCRKKKVRRKKYTKKFK